MANKQSKRRAPLQTNANEHQERKVRELAERYGVRVADVLRRFIDVVDDPFLLPVCPVNQPAANQSEEVHA